MLRKSKGTESGMTAIGKGKAGSQGPRQAQHHGAEQVLLTRSGRRSVKRVIFEAGKN